MANDNEFKLKFGAETKDLEKGIKSALKEIRKLEEAQGDLSAEMLIGKKSFDEYEKGIHDLQTSSNRYARAVSSVQRNMKGLGSSMNANAVPAMQEFSRVIQDAPYGIHGVANNIQQLTAQFGYLSSKSGGTINALKGMVSSLIGPAGILLAVSLVTTVMVKYGDQILEFITGNEDATKSANKLTEALDNQIKKLNQLQTVLGSELELAKKGAVARAKAEGKSEEEIYALRKKYNEAAISVLETTLSEQKKIEKQAFEARKQAKFAFDRDDSKKNKEALKILTENYEKSTSESAKILRDLNKAKANLYIDDYNEYSRINKESTSDYSKSEKAKSKELEKALAERLKANTAYYKAVARLQSDIRGRTAGTTSFRTEDNTPKSDAGDIAGEDWVTIFDPAPLLEAGDRMAEAADNNGTKLVDSIDKTASLAGQAAQVLSKHLEAAFIGIGEYLGNMLSGQADSIENGGDKILAAFGSFLGDLGKMAIAYGSFQLAMAIAGSGPPNPVSAGIMIAAGIGMVAVGKAISNLNKEAPRASIGSYGGASSMSSGGSSVSGSNYTPYQGTYSFEIQGTKLVSVINETQARNGALGGTTTISGI